MSNVDHMETKYTLICGMTFVVGSDMGTNHLGEHMAKCLMTKEAETVLKTHLSVEMLMRCRRFPTICLSKRDYIGFIRRIIRHNYLFKMRQLEFLEEWLMVFIQYLNTHKADFLLSPREESKIFFPNYLAGLPLQRFMNG